MSDENKKPRNIPLYIRVSQDEYDIIQNRMAELGTKNLTAFARKMLLNGYILNVDISPIKELVSLQRRCANNLNQVAVHANTHGIYQNEITGLQKDYNALWEPLSELIKQLTKVVEL
jgi:hypothetical protein